MTVGLLLETNEQFKYIFIYFLYMEFFRNFPNSYPTFE